MILLYLGRFPYLKVLFNESDPMKAIKLIDETCPDILLLDLEMPGLHGLQLYQSLAHQPVLLICSGHGNYAYEASGLAAVAYFPKWIPFESFEKAVLRAISWVDFLAPLDLSVDSIVVTSTQGKGMKIAIPIAEILHIEVQDKISIFHCTDFDREARITLKLVQKLLPDDRFLRTHKSHIVNVTKVADFSHSSLIIHGCEHSVPIGKSYLLDVMKRIDR